MDRDAFDVFCPECNILVNAEVIAHGSGAYRSDAVSPLEEVDAEYRIDHYYVAVCRRCGGAFLIRQAIFGVPGEFETITDESVLFPPEATAGLEGLPDSIARTLAQAHRSFSTASYDAAALMCRRALEGVCTLLKAKGLALAQRLADLQAAGYIDTRLLNWAHGVRLIGNEAAHDIDTTVTLEDARDIIDLTEALLMYVFTLDAKFRSFSGRRKARESA